MSEMIPAGNYRAVAIEINTDSGPTYVQFGESSNGNAQAVVNFEIMDGDQAGRKIAWFGHFTEKTIQRTVESLRYCGFMGDDLAAAVTQALDQEVQIVVKHEEYQGKTTAKVAWVNRAGGGGFKLDKPMANDSLRTFAAKLRNSVRQVPETPGKKAERGSAPPSGGDSGGQQSSSSGRNGGPPDHTDDEIPF